MLKENCFCETNLNNIRLDKWGLYFKTLLLAASCKDWGKKGRKHPKIEFYQYGLYMHIAYSILNMFKLETLDNSSCGNKLKNDVEFQSVKKKMSLLCIKKTEIYMFIIK